LSGEPLATIMPESGRLASKTAPAATRTNGKPRLRAAKSETKLDLPISSEPPATAAATADPLFAG
jgi:hypothetical protein